MKMLLAVIALALASCGSNPLQNPEQAVFAARGDYELALKAAVTYKRLPLCSATSTPLCHTASVVTLLQKTDDTAFTLLEAAKTTVRSPGAGLNAQTAAVAAQQAVAAFKTITDSLGSK